VKLSQRRRGKSFKNIELIAVARAILEDIQPASVRAVCYQLFNRKLLASMAKNETNRVSAQLRDARENGLIPWDWIVDETREAEYGRCRRPARSCTRQRRRRPRPRQTRRRSDARR
jgi:hypothetical protein